MKSRAGRGARKGSRRSAAGIDRRGAAKAGGNGKRCDKPAPSPPKKPRICKKDVTARQAITLPGKLERWPIDRLKPCEKNPRTHSPEQIAKIVASLKEFGWTNPILADRKGRIIAGHGRILAARELGMTEVPVIQLGHLTEVQRRAYLLADNRLALDASWDLAPLSEELIALAALDFDLTLAGFDLDELQAHLEVQDGEPPLPFEEPGDPVSRIGDLWLLGQHRLLCGDPHDSASFVRLGESHGGSGHCCFAVDSDGASCDRIILEWQEATGGTAKLEGDGGTFDALAAERRAEWGE